jgi:hypothetical protein
VSFFLTHKAGCTTLSITTFSNFTKVVFFRVFFTRTLKIQKVQKWQTPFWNPL